MSARTVLIALTLALVAAARSDSAAVDQPDATTVPTFGRVVIYAPVQPPDHVVLFVSGEAGWTGDVVGMAEHLRDRGALVAGIDLRTLRASLETAGGCAYPASDLEQLARALQLRQKLPSYQRPILAGYSSGAALAYAALVAAPPETFAGVISLGFCPTLDLGVESCEMRGLKATPRKRKGGFDLSPFRDLRVPWTVLQGTQDRTCPLASVRAFVAGSGSARLIAVPRAGHALAPAGDWEAAIDDADGAVGATMRAHEEPSLPVPEIGDLPLVEVPVTGGPDRHLLAILASGDGGWAEIDKGVASGLAAAGVPTVGWSSLKYYWTPRTPEAAAADLARIIEHYTTAWRKEQVILVGYSFGADVLPFLVNRLPPAVRARVASVALLGLSDTAVFEFRVAEWFGGGGGTALPTVPEVGRVAVPITCVYGEGEDDTACPSVRGARVTVVSVGEGHHFGAEYGRLAEVILRQP